MTGSVSAKDSVIAAVMDICDVDASELSDATQLGDEGLGLDSIAILELLLAIEAATGKTLRSEDLTGTTMSTVGSLVTYMDSLDLG